MVYVRWDINDDVDTCVEYSDMDLLELAYHKQTGVPL